jgi:hypothetical protein
LGVAAQLLLREEQVPVHGDVKHSAGGGDEPCLGVEFLAQLRRQTGGAGLVVSNDAVSDRDIHVQNRSPGPAGGKGARLIFSR